MKEKKFLKCICCGGLTFHRLKGWWIHQKCQKELEWRIMLAKHELPNIQYELLFGNTEDLKRALSSFLNNDFDDIAKHRTELRERAWILLEEKYGKPSWMKQGVKE